MNISNSNSILPHSKLKNDLNSDGLLTFEEMGVSQEEFDSYDENSDGMINSRELKNSVHVSIDSTDDIEDTLLKTENKQSSPLSELKNRMTTSNHETQDASTAIKLNLYVSNLDINLKTA